MMITNRVFALFRLGAAAAAALLAFPAAAHEADEYLLPCSLQQRPEACEVDAAQFRKIYARAFKKDYQAQRNLAYLLWKGDQAVQPRRVTSCAWRLVIVTSGSPKVDESDYANVRILCGTLNSDETARAKLEATNLTTRIASGGKIDDTIVKPKPGLDSTAEPLRPR